MKFELKQHIRDWCDHNKITVYFDVDLRKRTYFFIGGSAEVLLAPKSMIEMQQCLQICTSLDISPKILGKGSNLLITKPNIPIVISTENLCNYSIQENYIVAEAGTSLPVVVKKSVHNRLALEHLVGIPGTIGGAIYGNAGTKVGGELYAIGDYVEEVTTLSLMNAQLVTWKKPQLLFTYRSSNLSSQLIVQAKLKVPYDTHNTAITKWKSLARKKSSAQPYGKKSAGCIFRNPPHMSAWQLIDQAGLRNFRCGDIVISSQHANFIVNTGNGRAEDVLMVISHIQQRIYEEFGIRLVLEIQIW